MAEIQIDNNPRPGILKELDEGALDLIFDTLQGDIYSFPIPSFIRETISNGLDGIIEREIAKEILNGKSQEEFYLQRTDDKLLKDSSFDDSYYNLKFLSKENRVFVDYKVDNPRDTIIIKDEGVGLSGSRLQGYFKIGYSSKRNMKDVIGKFGSGSKSALATGVDYFIMHTTYNGFKTSFMIFKNDYEAITPNHLEGRSDIWTVKMSDGSIHAKEIYWEPAVGVNSVAVELEVKKHNKNSFINAVKNQFQYFSGKVRLAYEDEYGDSVIDHLNESPLYESDHILIPQYSTYTVPHILVDGISYGPIDFPELEIEKMSGKIALKVKATDIDITQSRETLKYTEKTKKAILNLVEIARDEATDYVTELLDVEDPKNLFKLNDIYGRLSKDGSTAVAAVFSKFLSMHNLKPKFNFNLGRKVAEKIDGTFTGQFLIEQIIVKSRLNSNLFDFLFYNFHVRELSTDLDGTTLKLVSDRVSNFETLRFKKIVYAKSASLGPKLANHLLKKYDTESIIYIRPRTDRTKTELEGPISGEYSVKSVDTYVNELLITYAELNLDTYEVVYDETVELENLEGATVEVALTPAQERKLNEEVLYTYFDSSIDCNYGTEFQYVSRRRQRETVKVTKIGSHFKNENILIVTGSYTKLGHFVEMAQLINPSKHDKLIIYIAQDKVKHFLPHGILITDYFRTINPKTGELMIGEHIRTLNTLKHLQELIDKYEDFSQKYNILEAFTTVDANRIESTYNRSKEASPEKILKDGYDIDEDLIKDIFGYFEVLTEFHHVVKTGNKELIAAKALQFFNSTDVYTVDAYDEEFIGDLKEQFEHLSVISPVLNLISDNENLADAKDLIQLLINTKHQENDKLKL